LEYELLKLKNSTPQATQNQRNVYPFKPRVKYANASFAFLNREPRQQHDFLLIKTTNAFA
jgi:hypothetical protein